MSDTAVLVIDMLNNYRHPDAQQLADNVARIIDQLVELIENADDHNDADLIYVNRQHDAQVTEQCILYSAPTVTCVTTTS